MKKIALPLLMALLLVLTIMAGYGQSYAQSGLKGRAVNRELRNLSGKQISIKAGSKVFTIDLYDNPTANDLASKLPLTLTANNYAGYDEKVIRLGKPLSMQNAPDGDDPEIPEFGYYHPGQWLAIYYGHIGYWSGKVPLGRINATVDELRSIPGNTSVTIEVVSN